MNQPRLNRNIRIRLSEQEDRQLVYLSQMRGFKNRSRIVRKMIRESIGQEPDLLHDDLNAFRQAVRELNAVGRNLNQVARALNMGEYTSPELHKDLMSKISIKVSALEKELRDIVLRTRHRWIKNG